MATVTQDDLGFGNNILDITPESWSTKERIDKLGLIHIKHFCFVEGIVKKVKREATAWGIYL